ncbi:hypothetical protein AGABI1DRAFT_132109 [Agaricus bisporus var. burnettii JB137-S8]|uniref:Cytochrome P450 n=1 Tax=Agaricus bisporus var. burnettii (strain JB137-S8 / ATCC MYA-4627 / FGSC 10392) TaxID=597362 RepID=K5XM20_AGABU|nr:uncharacterized protein AGABI1DRAFT_132109 [Agaricus bisporus var. burnettii JB137-S8]EKM75570.1 hypothetical protein AGABI1DRAFT_132109 [Agaricus bisporus var. burnettii JB137-S8]
MISLPEVILASTISWIGWKALKGFVLASSLDNLPGPPSTSIFHGNIGDLLSYDGWNYHRHILATYGRAQKISGTLGSRVFLTCDPKALHHILVKDSQFYEMSTGRNKAYMGEGLVGVSGEQHRKQRKLMTAVFSTKHVREMIPLFYEVTDRLCSTLKSKLHDGPQEVDIHNWLTRTALELIGQCGMDCSFDSLSGEGTHHPCAKAIKQFLPLASGSFGFVLNPLFPYINNWNFPRLKRFIVEHIPLDRVQKLKHVVDVIYNNSREIIEKKKSALASNDEAVAAEMMEKKDIITTLMRANLEADEDNRLTDEEVCGQVSYVIQTFIFAATDTTSSALARVFHILSMDTVAQDKLRKEIREAQRNGQLTYDQLVSLPYLDAVCRETLRLFPPVNLPSVRIAGRDSMVPLSKPIIGKNGKEIREIMIPKGTNIMVSVTGSNTDPDIWGVDALEWKPERWLSALPKSLEEARLPGVFSHMMTFLGGSRGCIGLNFSQLEMKVIMAALLSSFKFEVAPKHKITWKMTGISAPYVEQFEGTHQALPVLMSLVSD